MMMKRKGLAALLVLSLLAGVLPLGAVSALADAPSRQVIYVGNENVASGGYWTTSNDGTVTAFTGEGTPADNFIHYDATNNVLTLHNATRGRDYTVCLPLTQRQRGMILAGGLLNYTRESQEK